MKFRQYFLQQTAEDVDLQVAGILLKHLLTAESFEGLNCPVGGAEVMGTVAKILGKEAPAVDPLVAVLLCNGTPEYRPALQNMTELLTAGFHIIFIWEKLIAVMVVWEMAIV